MKAILFALLTAALAAPAFAADPPQQGDQEHRYEKPSKPHLICKRDQDTGTRMSGRICKTAEQWAASGVDEDSGKLDAVNHQTTTLDDASKGLTGPGGQGMPRGPQ